MDHDRGRHLGIQGQELPLRVPRPDPFRPVRPGGGELHRRERQGQARDRAEGREGRDHPRGRAVRGRRCRRRRAFRQGERPAGGDARGVFRDRSGPLVARHQAQAGARRRDLSRRLQSRHHVVPAPVARSRAALQDADRQRRRLQPARQAARHLRARTSTISATSIRFRHNCSSRKLWRPAWAT